ncbi:hypothetical protein Cni_G18736 [Canna indica]|uniref:Uncharacterized protein n=1 Tax=Canna indica TaxID=4628 RepID=A0AAQ3KLM8_9LILI|nr:hypothetical protein Cni_G18736 [Canna indica]
MPPPISSHPGSPSPITLHLSRAPEACMATSQQQLISESFSRRWPMNTKSPSHDLNVGRRHLSFGAQDAGFASRRRASTAAADDDFDFNTPKSESSFQVHADQIFSKGFLLHLHGHSTTTTAPKYAVACNSHSLISSSKSLLISRPAISNGALPLFHSAKVSPNSSCSSVDAASKSYWKFKLHFLGNCMKSSKKTLGRCFSFVTPPYKKVRCLSASKSARSCKDSARSYPRTSSSFSNMNLCRSNADISIYDAILHCKKSIGLECG